jgi:hypothetical protein
VLALALVLDDEPEGKGLGACERRVAARFGFADQGRPADAWSAKGSTGSGSVSARHSAVGRVYHHRQWCEAAAARANSAVGTRKRKSMTVEFMSAGARRR